MGQRTQIGVNVIFIGTDGTERVRREIYHYQWGGYSNIMFLSLLEFFRNVRKHICKAKFINVRDNNFKVQDKKYSDKIRNEMEKEFKKNNWLKTDFIDIIDYEINKTSINLSNFSNYYSNADINKISEEEYYMFLLETQDCDNGRIMIDVVLDGRNSYCKWNFNKNIFDKNKTVFERAIEGATEKIDIIKTYWKFDKNDCNTFDDIANEINKIAILNDNNSYSIIEYDGEYFKNKLKSFTK